MTASERKNKTHDMGGQPGGPIPIDSPVGPVFAKDWQARALAITVAAGGLGKWNLDSSRHARERLPAADYQAYSYYEKWLAGLATLLVETGLVSTDELRKGQALPGAARPAVTAPTAEQVAAALARGGPSVRPDRAPPRFALGQRVTVLDPDQITLSPNGHTRLPAYSAGCTGQIIRHHHSHVLPDSNAHGLGEAPEHLYGVCFAAADIWPEAGDTADEVCLDLWESYLVPADRS